MLLLSTNWKLQGLAVAQQEAGALRVVAQQEAGALRVVAQQKPGAERVVVWVVAQ